MKRNFTKLLFAFILGGAFAVNAQENHLHDNEHLHNPNADKFNLPLDFDKDSLVGFNESAAWQQAKMSSDYEWQQRRMVAVLKRNYIDFKYGFSKPAPPITVQGPCANPDFETGTTANWVTQESPNNNSQTMLAWTGSATSQVVAIPTTNTDPNLGGLLPLNPPGSGNFICRLGSSTTTSGGYSYRASQTFTVTASNSVFIYRYAAVLERTSPHSCSEQPFFNVTFKDCAGNPIQCGQYAVTAVGSGCTSGDPSFNTTANATWAFKPWTTAAFDLTPYIGQCVSLEFTVGGCVISQAAHRGYAYIDASCAPMTLNLNGANIPVGQTNTALCGGATTNTICAPAGFSYNWSGPGVTGQTGQCVNSNSTGTYSVTLGVPGTACSFSPILYTTFDAMPNPTVTAAVTQPTCAFPAGTATITATGGTGAYTYSWTPAAPSGSVNTNLPTSSVYTVSAIDANGCRGTTIFSVDPYPPAPDYTVNVTPSYSLTCLSPSTTITFIPNTATSQGQWAGPSGTFPSTVTSVVVTSPGVYTYTAINTVSTCSLTGSINITGVVIQPTLTASVIQPTCTAPFGTASITPSGGTGPFTYTWTPITVTAPFGDTNTNLAPGSSYTVAAIDNLGCSASTTFSVDNFAGLPMYSSSITSSSISCSTPSTTITFAPTHSNTETSWWGPSGVITTTNITTNAAGVYTATATNTLSTCSETSTFTITIDTVKPIATYTVGCNVNIISVNAAVTASNTTLDWTAPTLTPTSIGNPATSSAIGVYTLTATDTINGCIQTYTANTSIPPITITNTPNTNVITCNTPTINVLAQSAATGTLTYSWTNGTTTSTVNPYPITSNGTYTAVVQVLNGCSNYSVVTITTNTVASVSIIPSSAIIPCSTGSVSLNASPNAGGPYTYTWTTASSTSTTLPLVVSTSGVYTVAALNTANGCTTTATQVITAETISASFYANVYAGETPLPVTFTNTSISGNPVGTNYTWTFGDGAGLASNDTTVSHTYVTAGDFPVILTAENGVCRDTAIRYIKVDIISKFIVPNVFTPNGDGRNDTFTFDAMNMGEITLTIYDRWGLMMFEGTQTGNIKWDGSTKNGNSVPDGTYFYIIKATGLDGKGYDLQGSVNVFK